MDSPNIYSIRDQSRLYLIATQGKKGFYRWSVWRLTDPSDSVHKLIKDGGHCEANKDRSSFAASGPLAGTWRSEAEAIDNARQMYPAPRWWGGPFRWLALGLALAVVLRYLI